jgi:hypothetical protein
MDFAGFFLYFLITVAIETPVLLLGLSRRHSWQRRLFAGFWLNACSYPIVYFVLPELIDTRERWGLYLLVAETFAPAAECALFYFAFWVPPAAQDPRRARTGTAWGPPGSVQVETREDGIRAPSGIEEASAKPVTHAALAPASPAPPVVREARFDLIRDMAVIVLANLLSFGPLELIRVYTDWTPLQLLPSS